MEYLGDIEFPKVEYFHGGYPVVHVRYRMNRVDPRQINSGIAFYDIHSRVVGSTIEMTTIEALASGRPSDDGYRLHLPRNAKGKFDVVYINPDGSRHAVGTVEIP